ncbi:MAG: hypothetical protein ACI4O0_07840 [Candidatus Limivicinus sp.]
MGIPPNNIKIITPFLELLQVLFGLSQVLISGSQIRMCVGGLCLRSF